jgi:hypothetical protein
MLPLVAENSTPCASGTVVVVTCPGGVVVVELVAVFVFEDEHDATSRRSAIATAVVEISRLGMVTVGEGSGHASPSGAGLVILSRWPKGTATR